MSELEMPVGTSGGRKRTTRRKRGAIGTPVEGGFKCDGCPKVCKVQRQLDSHWRFHCPSGPKERLQCPHCSESYGSHEALRKHVKKTHETETYVQVGRAKRQQTEDDRQLEVMFNRICGKGGVKHFRHGFLFEYDCPNRIARMTFEEVDPRCLQGDNRRQGHHWRMDHDLPKDTSVQEHDIDEIRSHTWHFGHLVCASYHQFDEDRKDAVKLTSIGCSQHAVVNIGAWSQLENSFKYLSLRDRTFVITATILGEEPEIVPKEGSTRKMARPASFIKIAVLLTRDEKWYWDGFHIINSEKSFQSPTQYRIKTLNELNSLFKDYELLAGIKDVAEQKPLYEEGQSLIPPPPPEPDMEPIQDSAIGMEFENQELKTENQELKTENQELNTKLAAALKRISELESK